MGVFVPAPLVQRMRQYNRRIFDLNKEKVYKLTKLDASSPTLQLSASVTMFLPRTAKATRKWSVFFPKP
ncbi:hypothetical protein [Bacteroides finegoldii]|uniref:hypothetical protein n=1 Tax=Bacteroides finegoldii TaxID=338188 RepID=UPI001FCCBE91|nr:hypothetical protein [Bacteroides finegoldii]